MFAELNFPQKIALICAVLLGFSVPISTIADSVLVALLLIFAMLGWYSVYPRLVWQHPLAKAGLMLLGLLGLGCFYGTEAISSGWAIWSKYNDLLLIPLLLPVFAEARCRDFGGMAFMLAMALTLVLSYAIWLGLFSGSGLFTDRLPDNPVVFKLHITHGIFMGFAAFAAMVRAVHSKGNWRVLWGVGSLLALFNALAMTQGRSGYLTVAVLVLYGGWQGLRNYRRPQHKVVLLALVLMLGLGAVSVSKLLPRIQLAQQEAQSWWNGSRRGDLSSSIGTRLDMWQTTCAIIAKHPWLGVGTGGFANSYANASALSKKPLANNPHNQFLLFWAQLGVVGVLAFGYFLATAWRTAAQLATHVDTLLARGLVLTLVAGCLFNSLLLDHAEGLFFAWGFGLLFAGFRRRDENGKTLETLDICKSRRTG